LDANNRKTLLIVEDNPADKTHLLRMLQNSDHSFSNIVCVSSFAEAKQYFAANTPSCCLLDCNLIDGTATRLLEEIAIEPNTTPCPIIIITGIENTDNAVALMKKGVMDYLTKPILNGFNLVQSINHALTTWTLQSQINYLALHDSLTSLINRDLFVDRLNQLFNTYSRTRIPFSLIYIDLDDFKRVNDQHGHEAGDHLLADFAKKLMRSLRETDTVARLGGDEFGVLLPDTNAEQCLLAINKLLVDLSEPLHWNKHKFLINLSMGITCYPNQANGYQELMREADFALYQSKKNGRSQYSMFDQEMQRKVLSKRAINDALEHAIATNELKVFYQPIFDSHTLEVIEIEALIRWNFQGSWINPEKIINYIIDQDLTNPFHIWLFDNALKQLKQWKADMPSLTMAINLPANLPSDNSILIHLEDFIERHDLEFQDIIIEITESHFMRHPAEAKEQLLKLRACNAGISIDDFGTGFSSIQYLANLPCNQLKIDKCFFLTLSDNRKNEQIIKFIASLAKNLELASVAEGVESGELVEQAIAFGCDRLQGFWLGAPVAGNTDLTEFLLRSKQEGRRILAL
jgi:diguanylate cyclase (GGDEF)-like protein